MCRVFGELRSQGIEVVSRSGCYFVRYDAGAHQVAWREDELSGEEFERLRQGGAACDEVIVALQQRLLQRGEDPYVQNWLPRSG